jgi:hypothetical protein
METAFVIALRIWVGLMGVLGLAAAFRAGEFRWSRGPLIRPQWLGRVFFAVIGVFLIGIAVFLRKAN